MRRGRQENAKGGWGWKKRNDQCTTIAVHSCRNGETGHGGMRGVTISRVQHTHTQPLPFTSTHTSASLYVPHPSRVSFRRCVRIRAVIDS